MKEMFPQIGDSIQTPRFCTVTISAVFADFDECFRCGYTESAHMRNKPYLVYGKTIGENKMIFAACPQF